MPPTNYSPSITEYTPSPSKLRDEQPLPAHALLRQLTQESIVLSEDVRKLNPAQHASLASASTIERLTQKLVELRLLTPYQAGRVAAGKTQGLVVGNYRLLERLGAGGMGVVFLAEHIRMRNLVAIKILAETFEPQKTLVPRFYAETRAIAKLKHPNIVSAIDCGEVAAADEGARALHYFVMEYVRGKDLEAMVVEDGPMDVQKACDIITQIADALSEAHRQGLVHRDIKPSNILVTPEGKAKLLDFGLAQQNNNRMTEAGTILGTIGYMAPEQAKDASTVDARADIYSLGATLYWCLTGQDPFPNRGHITQELIQRLTQPPPSTRSIRPEVPADLDHVVARMMSVDPEERYPTTLAVSRALLPYVHDEQRDTLLGLNQSHSTIQTLAASQNSALKRRVLIVDDEPGIRDVVRLALGSEGIPCTEARNGAEALDRIRTQPFELILLDVVLPDIGGPEILRQSRFQTATPNQKVILMSGQLHSDEMANLLLKGADDFLVKPFSIVQLVARVRATLRLKEAQDRTEVMKQKLLAINAELGTSVSQRDTDLVRARNSVARTLTKLLVQRQAEGEGHLKRMPRYCKLLAQAIAAADDVSPVTESFIENLELAAPLHDIGKLLLPDHILLKPGKFDNDERLQMQEHATLGAGILAEMRGQFGFANSFLEMAIDIARHHHERYDGTGYPDQLQGDNIPLAARIVSICDVYDALRTRKAYKPALSHQTALLSMVNAVTSQFDPALLSLFRNLAADFDQIFREIGD